MTYSVGMAIVDRLNNLTENVPALFLFEIFVIYNSIEEFSSFANPE
jgi:hypothetical protein